MSQHDKIERELDGTQSRGTTPTPDIAQPHPKQAEAMRLFEAIQSNRNFGISTNIGQIASSLTSVVEVSKFPEELFVQHFLPLFAGEVEATPDVNYTTWVEKVAGGMSSPVDIVDADGVVLYRIPAVFNESVLEQTAPGAMAMTHLERQYSRLKEFDAAGSQQFLSKSLSSMHIKGEPTQEVYDNMRTWNDILKRYGREDKIIKLIDDAKDPNRDKPLASAVVADPTGLGEYELDTD